MINKFIGSICNCSNYCLTLDDINCSPDHDQTIITIVMTLKEKQSLFLRSLVYSTLQEGQVKVDQNYSIFCVVKTLCEKPPPPTTASPTIPTIPNNTNTTTSEVTDENNLVIAIAISAVIVITLLILVLLIIVVVMLRSHKHKQKAKQNPQTIPHVTNPVQLTSRNTASNGHSSISSNESGVFSDCSDSGLPVSDSTNDSFPPETIQYTDNSNTNLPNGYARTNPSFPAVISTINPSSTKDKKHKIIKTNKRNSVPKHHRNMQPVNEQQNIQWQENKNYSQLNPYNSAPNPSKLPATMPNCKQITEVHLYDDVEGINKSIRRAAASQVHHKTKHRPSATPCITQHSNYNVSPVNGVTSGNGAKLLFTTNYKHPSSSQV